MWKIVCLQVLLLPFMFVQAAPAGEMRRYTVKRTAEIINPDGILSEMSWTRASATDDFVIYSDGSKPVFPTSAKMLWDEHYLYIAFTMTDQDVWSEKTSWYPGDECLCLEEVAEVFIDPDGDGENYIEVEINPLQTVMDLTLTKAYASGGKADFEWRLCGLKSGISIDGTLNDLSDVDRRWVCELAFPFREMAFCAPTQSFPPRAGDSWRINLYRYEYGRMNRLFRELSAWNQTDAKRGFHAPDLFGTIQFSAESAHE